MNAVAVNRSKGFVLLDDGTVVQLDQMFDIFGDETDDAAEAVSATASLPDGRWMAIDLVAFDPIAVH
jgi:hypothetical protein